MRINKSQITEAIRATVEAFNRGEDALAVLNYRGRLLGYAHTISREQGETLRAAYLTGGLASAVNVAVDLVTSQGVTVTDDEVVTAAEPTLPATLDGFTLTTEVAGKVEVAAKALADTLFTNGRAAALTQVARLAQGAGLTLTPAQAEEIVTNFTAALRDNGFDAAEQALEEAYEALTTPVVEAPAETLEVRVARLEQIARANGLL